MLISEFGANTIEAGEEGQARLIRESWDGLIAAGAAGGIVFEFADKWWKNYNNPARPGDWWTRVPAPDDEMHHDDDPEETYGLVTAERKPKPAFRTVSDMYRRQSGPPDGPDVRSGNDYDAGSCGWRWMGMGATAARSAAPHWSTTSSPGCAS